MENHYRFSTNSDSTELIWLTDDNYTRYSNIRCCMCNDTMTGGIIWQKTYLNRYIGSMVYEWKKQNETHNHALYGY